MEPVWYYARGNVEQGPITAAQIQALAATGSIRKDDLVWKEGMDDWVPAGSLEELYPSRNNNKKKADSAEEPPPAQPQQKKEVFRQMPPARPSTGDVEPLLRLATRLLVVVGFILVLLSRGCDGLAARNVARVKGFAAAAEARFESEWARKRAPLEDQQYSLRQTTDLAPEQRQRLNEIDEELSKLTKDQTAERRRLQTSQWQGHSLRADTEEADQLAWSFWWQLVFLFGTMVLSVGFVGIATSSEGPERWVSLAMLGVILYSIYTGSSVWG